MTTIFEAVTERGIAQTTDPDIAEHWSTERELRVTAVVAGDVV